VMLRDESVNRRAHRRRHRDDVHQIADICKAGERPALPIHEEP
jgi:hypothetical protein